MRVSLDCVTPHETKRGIGREEGGPEISALFRVTRPNFCILTCQGVDATEPRQQRPSGLRSVVRGFRLLADDRKLFLPSKSENAFEKQTREKRSRLKLRSREKKLSGWRPRRPARGKKVGRSIDLCVCVSYRRVRQFSGSFPLQHRVRGDYSQQG